MLADADHQVSGTKHRVVRPHPKLAIIAYFADGLAAAHKWVPAERPVQVLLELSPEHSIELCIQEVVQTPVLVQVVYESVGGSRIHQRYQILDVADLEF
ncbi:hypothetical protein MesoLj113b_65020 [Mesorhizobium sp. 113-3-3]|nr:hypothetical protein MesoLj113b_65020 [Mesorhizobium sp. 113-3-3]BCG90838.1 hypothetical protein MesoLj113c_69480 [Mesorhizobium sp. 113-3-9]BCH12492.1 hypothetical protein MesoLj131c_67500 [Mesorhizobium sp. 131-3-5]BCH35017.1 hypothetical protein MesoLjLc_69470 [Mesorhizobium sp. L-8-10]